MTQQTDYQCIALDLDGTLLNQDHDIPAATIEAINAIKAHKTVLLVTGRHHTAAKPYYDKLALTTPIICCNGTYLYDYATQSVLMENAIPREVALTFIEQAQAHHLNAVVYIDDAMIHRADSPVPYMLKMEQWANSFPPAKRPHIYQSERFIEEIAQAKYVWKFVIEGEIAALDSFKALPIIQSHFTGEQSWHNRIDFAYRGNSKGNRLKAYYTSLGLNQSQVIAVGDNHNDISMFNVAGLAVAMRNAEQSIQAAANQVTQTDNNGDGIAQLIQTYLV